MIQVKLRTTAPVFDYKTLRQLSSTWLVTGKFVPFLVDEEEELGFLRR